MPLIVSSAILATGKIFAGLFDTTVKNRMRKQETKLSDSWIAAHIRKKYASFTGLERLSRNTENQTTPQMQNRNRNDRKLEIKLLVFKYVI